MAAGMGSRFGGLKQIEPCGPNGEFIIDYSIYDAINSGFSKIVFVIKEENYKIFKETIISRIKTTIPVEVVFQKIEDVPSFVKIPDTRVKPWGTAHAIYSAKDAITEPFLVINADDFYGQDAYRVAMEFLQNIKKRVYGIIGYEASKTITENGAVKRGVLITEKNDLLNSIIESSLVLDNNEIICKPLNGSREFKIKPNALVSMNMLTFDLTIFPYLKDKLSNFFETNINNLESCECLIPDILDMAKKENYADVKILHTSSNWYGITYREDKKYLAEKINELINKGEYPNNLWEEK
jgi:UTP-glucose-1-phosphate uridylyltransferase